MTRSILFALLAASLWGFNGILVKRGVERTSPLSGAFTSMVFGLLPLLTLLFFSHEFRNICSLTVDLLLFLLGAGVFSMLGRTLSFLSVGKIGATRTYSLTTTSVFFSAVLATVFLGENLTLPLVLGIVMNIVGIYFLVSEGASNGSA